jgi:hypothetical protein
VVRHERPDATNPGATLADLGVPRTYPNHELVAYSVRAFVGALPVTGFLFALWAIVLVAVITAGAGGIVLVIMLPVSALFAAIAGFGIRSVERRTPQEVDIGPSSIAARWGSPEPRTELVTFERIDSVDPRRWKWTSGRGAYARFIPATVEVRPVATGPDHVASEDDTHLYVSDANAARLEAVLASWKSRQPKPPRPPEVQPKPPLPPEVPEILSAANAWGLADP